MARCGCSGTCSCVIIEGARISITGNGTPDNPYQISVDAEGDTVTTTDLANALLGYLELPDPGDPVDAIPVKQPDGSVSWVVPTPSAEVQEGIFDFTGGGGSTKTMPNPVTSKQTFWRGLATGNFTIAALPTVTTPGAIAVTLKIKQDATGGRNVTFPTIDWIGGAQPTIATAPNAVTYITLWTEGSSDVWHGVGNGAGYTVRVVTSASTGTNLVAKGGEVILVDTTGGAVAMTMQASNLNTRDALVKWVAGATVPTLTLAAGDHINTTSGGTSATFYELTEAYRFTPDGVNVWAITGMDISVARLVRIPASGVTSGYVPIANGSGGYAWGAQSGGGGGFDQRWEPADNGLKAANMDPALAAATGNAILGTSTTYAFRVKVKSGVAITGAAFQILSAPVGALGGGFQVALAASDATGTIVASSGDVQTSFASGGPVLIPFTTPYTPGADGYMFVVLRTGTAATTMPKLSAGAVAVEVNIGLTTGTAVAPNAAGAPRFATAAVAWTVPTAPAALGNITTSSALGLWAGLY